MGMGNVPSVPSLALGSGEVTLMAMTSAYAAFADQGQLRPAISSGASKMPTGRCCSGAALGGAGAFAQDRVPHDEHVVGCRELRDRVQGATGRLHAAGGGEDGHDERLRRCMVRRVHAASRHRCVDRIRQAAHDHRNGFAGELAVPMWARYMKQATEKDEPEAFKSPQGLTAVSVCRETGQLPGRSASG